MLLLQQAMHDGCLQYNSIPHHPLDLQADAGRTQQRMQHELVSVRSEVSVAKKTIQRVTANVAQLESCIHAHVDQQASLQAEVTSLRDSLQVNATDTCQPFLAKLAKVESQCMGFGLCAPIPTSMKPCLAQHHSVTFCSCLVT